MHWNRGRTGHVRAQRVRKADVAQLQVSAPRGLHRRVARVGPVRLRLRPPVTCAEPPALHSITALPRNPQSCGTQPSDVHSMLAKVLAHGCGVQAELPARAPVLARAHQAPGGSAAAMVGSGSLSASSSRILVAPNESSPQSHLS